MQQIICRFVNVQDRRLGKGIIHMKVQRKRKVISRNLVREMNLWTDLLLSYCQMLQFPATTSQRKGSINFWLQQPSSDEHVMYPTLLRRHLQLQSSFSCYYIQDFENFRPTSMVHIRSLAPASIASLTGETKRSKVREVLAHMQHRIFHSSPTITCNMAYLIHQQARYYQPDRISESSKTRN